MDPQSFEKRRRAIVFLSTAAAVAAVGGIVSCESPQGMKPAPGGRRDGRSPTDDRGPDAGARPADDATKPTDAASKDAAKPAQPKPQPVERPTPPKSEPAIRIKSGGLPKDAPRIEIKGPGPDVWIVEPGAGRPGTVASGPVEFRWTDQGWKVTERVGSASAAIVSVPARATLEISALGGEPQQLTAFGSTWPGRIRLVPQPNDVNEPVDVVHVVSMEEYLPGVIAKELFNKWGVATHRAQAIAARSWALCEMEMWRTRRHFDAVAGEMGQAWIGATAHRRSLDAVAATRGQVLVYASRVVPAYYSSCCGGARAAARDAISTSVVNDIAPLSVSGSDGRDCCSWSPTYRWQLKFDAATIAATLPAWARAEGFASLFKVDGIRRVEIAERNKAGRPVLFTITDAKGGVFGVPAERLRWALNADPRDPQNLRPAKERVKSAYFEPFLAGRELVISGRGHGHGVGMCQYGAEAMSKNGSSMQAILARYYPGASVERSYA
jgi:stage II sporulation protein D